MLQLSVFTFHTILLSPFFHTQLAKTPTLNVLFNRCTWWKTLKRSAEVSYNNKLNTPF